MRDDRHRGLNGWRRLWLVLTALGFMGSAPIAFYEAHRNTGLASAASYTDFRRTFENPACSTFISLPFDQLKAPDNSSPCSTIHTVRLLDKEAPIPYSLKRYLDKFWGALWSALIAFWVLAGWLMACINRRAFDRAEEFGTGL